MAGSELHSANLFDFALTRGPEEDVTTLLTMPGARLIRIVSTGQATPEDEWYDQDDNEWVVVLRGRAGLRIAGENEVREMTAGDFINLPAGLRHRVEWTDADEPTVWLALHYD
jgi:cupin 2 domain-containing protein